MCHCALFEQTPIVTLLGAQRDGPPLHYLVLSFVYMALDQNLGFGKLGWDVQLLQVIAVWFDSPRVYVMLR